MDVRFNQLQALHWLWLVAAVAGVVAVGLQLKRRALRRFASGELLGRLAGGAEGGGAHLRAALVLAALLCLVAALIDPRWGVTYAPIRQRGIDLFFVLDVSRSMLAEDVAPNRLERAKQDIADLVDRLGGDRVGLVTFAGTASVKSPLTVDYDAFLLAVDLVQTESAARGGSMLGDALRVAGESFTDDIHDHKAIIVLTDGEDQGSYPLEAARRLREEREVPVYTVGIGDPDEGARIPVQVQGQRVYLTHDGQEVWSRMNPTLLRDVALATGGAFIPVGTGTVDMGEVYEQRIEPMSKRDFQISPRIRRHVRYQWFAGLALLLLSAESMMRFGPVRGRHSQGSRR